MIVFEQIELIRRNRPLPRARVDGHGRDGRAHRVEPEQDEHLTGAEPLDGAGLASDWLLGRCVWPKTNASIGRLGVLQLRLHGVEAARDDQARDRQKYSNAGPWCPACVDTR